METRTRKPNPNYRQDWRNKAPPNNATHRYKRENILSLYKTFNSPPIQNKSDLQDILTPASPPLLSPLIPFTNPLGEEPNSRKYQPREKRSEYMPEWYEDQKDASKAKTDYSKKPENSKEANPEELEEKFTKVDLQVEEKLKKQEIEEDFQMPEWEEPEKTEYQFEQIKPVVKGIPMKPQAPIYDLSLLSYYYALGNPFVQTLIDYGVPFGNGGVTFSPNTKPFEKIWHYKDLEGRVHGPFSSLEMFSWTARNCFPPDLEISVGWSMNFIPMNVYLSFSQMEPEVYRGDDSKYNIKSNYRRDKGNYW